MGAMLSLMFLPFGRASRIAFLGGIGAFVLLSPLISMVTRLMLGPHVRMTDIHLIIWPSLLLSAWAMFCLFANRLHDIGRSAIWAIVPVFLPTLVMGGLTGFNQTGVGWGAIMTMFVGPLLYMGLAIVLLFFRGHDGPNRFGVRPAMA
ncbi:MAG: DUF805 domain-containing protein [Hyphomonadaceae bacterium]